MDSATAAIVRPRRSRYARNLGPNSKFGVVDILTTVSRKRGARMTSLVSQQTGPSSAVATIFEEHFRSGTGPQDTRETSLSQQRLRLGVRPYLSDAPPHCAIATVVLRGHLPKHRAGAGLPRLGQITVCGLLISVDRLSQRTWTSMVRLQTPTNHPILHPQPIAPLKRVCPIVEIARAHRPAVHEPNDSRPGFYGVDQRVCA